MAKEDGLQTEPKPAPRKSCWLLTWNPLKFAENEPQYSVGELENDRSQIGFAIAKWSCGVTTSIRAGDRVYLLRQGAEPRGIVASGTALSGVFTGIHWDEERPARGLLARSIYVKFDDIRLQEGGVLPLQVLNTQFPGVHWSAQSSGIRIPASAAKGLDRLWKSGRKPSGRG